MNYIQIAQRALRVGNMTNKKVEDQFFDSFIIELVKLEQLKKKAAEASKVDK